MNEPTYLQLEFPLNVYAHSLYLQQGFVEYLHYGLVEANEDAWEIGAWVAQQRSTDLLLARLPPPPARILTVGVGLGTLATFLVKQGYQVTGISPDPQQIALAKQQMDSDSLHCVSFEAFAPQVQGYDVILFQQAAQSIKPLALFNKAFSLLNEKGQLILIEEFSLRRTSEDQIERLPLLKASLAQAKRCGFQLTEQLDLSQQVIPTLDYSVKVIEHHRTQLLTDLSLTVEQIDSWLNTLRLFQRKYRDGRYGYTLLVFEKGKAPRWRITEVTDADQEAIRGLFKQVFESEMTLDLWTWKYVQGQGMAIAAWRGSEMIAHYGGVVRELLYFGQPKKGVQIVDVMTSVKERRFLTRQGPYFLVGATFPEYYVGYGQPTLLGFGFPTHIHTRLAELLGLYAPVGQITEIHWSTQKSWSHVFTRIRHLHPLEQPADREIIDQLWEQMRPDFQQVIIGQRHWAYVEYRYFKHPHKQYELLMVSHRWWGRPLGIVVLFREQAVCKLIDLIAPIAHIPILIQQTRRIVASWGIPTLSLWITETFAPLFTQTGGTQHPVDVSIPHGIWYEGPPVTEVKDHWWLMGGDTDFM